MLVINDPIGGNRIASNRVLTSTGTTIDVYRIVHGTTAFGVCNGTLNAS